MISYADRKIDIGDESYRIMDRLMELFLENPGVYLTEEEISALIGNTEARKELEELVKKGKLERISAVKKSGKKVYYGIRENF